MDGIILVSKPKKWTSHDVVLQIKKWLQVRKVGHFGTLDPMATGLLIVAVGKATRLFPFYSRKDKAYTGTICLGYSTETYDSEGERTTTEVKKLPSENDIKKAMKHFEGNFLQVPPPYSAKKHQGKPFYVLARQKKDIPHRTNQVTVYSFKLIEYSTPFLHFGTQCSTGTYIRSLAHDLGAFLSCGAHLSSLERVASGSFTIDQSLSLDSIYDFIKRKQPEHFLRSIETLLPEFPKIILRDSGTALAKSGRSVSLGEIEKITGEAKMEPDYKNGDIVRLFSRNGKIVAFARVSEEKKGYHPFLVLDPLNSSDKGISE